MTTIIFLVVVSVVASDVTIGFVQQSYKAVEGEGGVTLEIIVREGEIPANQNVEITLNTTDQSANGVSSYELVISIRAY